MTLDICRAELSDALDDDDDDVDEQQQGYPPKNKRASL
jgi:hypothetical protein